MPFTYIHFIVWNGRNKKDTAESVWIPILIKYHFHEDILLRIPKFSTIERFLISRGGKPDDIYDRIIDIACPKGSKLVLNIMNELKNM